jgi:hypothetical protein
VAQLVIHNLLYSLSNIQVTKSKRIRWAGYLERMWMIIHTQIMASENTKESNNLRDVSVDNNNTKLKRIMIS